MKQKTRKMGLKMKIVIPTGLLIIAVCVILGVSACLGFMNSMVAVGVEEAEMAADMSVKEIDYQLVAKLEPGDEDTEDYKTLLNTMRALKNDCGIAYIYILYTDGTKVYYGVDADETEGQLMIGEEFEESYESLKSVFDGEDYVQDGIDQSEYGSLVSVYKPIMDESGNVVAVLGCDYDASEIVSGMDSMIKNIVIIMIICVFVAIVLFWFIAGLIAKNLRLVNTKIYDLVYNEGDLTQKLDIRTGDELELIADNVNKLLDYIREIMINIADNSISLNSSSTNVVQQLTHAEDSISNVSSTMEEMSAAMEETSASLSQVNDAVIQIYDVIEMISNNANAGRNSSNVIMDKASEIHSKASEEQKNARAQAQQIADIVNEKIERSKAVQEINLLTANIINITEQTNLLALNASIEAARAGDAGRGFAIVADEIGKLATDSAQTATQIQKVSTEVIAAVNELAEKAEQMLTFTKEVAMDGYDMLLQTSQNYRDDVADMNNSMSCFASESERAMLSIDQIKEAISAVSIAVDECTIGVTGVTETMLDLTTNVGDIEKEAASNSNIAGLLNDEVHKFKLE